MEITYDKEIDALYVSLQKGRVAKTLPISESVFTDLDKSGNIVGIEILDASKSISDSRNKFFAFGGKSFNLPSLLKK